MPAWPGSDSVPLLETLASAIANAIRYLKEDAGIAAAVED